MGTTERVKEINDIYGWNLVLKAMCDNILDLERVLDLDFGNVITWLELGKAEEELQEIQNEEMKKRNKLK